MIFTVAVAQKKAQKSSGSAKMDFQFLAYQIFSSIGRGVRGVWEGGRVGGGEKRTMTGTCYTCYIILCIYSIEDMC